MLNIALNGFGRIGKSLVRILLKDHLEEKFCISAINVGLADIQTAAYSLKYDSVMGTLSYDVRVIDGALHGCGKPIQLVAQKNITQNMWKMLRADWVVDVSGHYTQRIDAEKHIRDGGAMGVIISAPAEGDDITIIMGINDTAFDATKHRIISLGSCTTNALIPVIDVVKSHTTIRSLCMTTVHAYTNSQALLDGIGSSSDLRRTRAATLNIVPSGTGALSLVKRLYPDIPVVGASLRVPVPVVSLLDVVIDMIDQPTTEVMMQWFREASHNKLTSIMTVNDEQLVSSDFKGTTYSTIVDATLSGVVGNIGKIMTWYDNEYGYCCRVRDFIMQHIS